MKHPVSYDEWLAYVDGELDNEAASRIRLHMSQCGECRALCEELMSATTNLRQAAAVFRSAHAFGADSVDRGRRRVLARIRAEGIATALDALDVDELSIARLRRLQCVVAPVCGAQTAFRLIVAALNRTPSTGANWNAFLGRLAELTSAVCGRSVARLVLQIGSSLS